MVAHVIIPVRDQLALTASIIEQLQAQTGWARCLVFDNGSADGTDEYLRRVSDLDHRIVHFRAPGLGIYQMWDYGVTCARGHGAEHIAILNNDIILAADTLRHLSAALNAHPCNWLAYPDYDSPIGDTPLHPVLRETLGTYRHGGMSGFAFMLHAHRVAWSPLVDPRFKHWCGDDDIAFAVEAAGGRQVRVEGLGVVHIGEATARHHDLAEQKARDLEACMAKWGR